MLLLGKRYQNILLDPLRDLGQQILWLPDNPAIDDRLAGHADLSVFRANDRTVFSTEGVYDHIVNSLTNRGYYVHKASKQGTIYPMDAGLCVCSVGQYVFYNPKTIDPAVRPFLTGRRIPITQGYTKCSICVVTSKAIITSDNVIGSRATQVGIDVLMIEPGHIILEGFDTGFIGGASIQLDDHTLAFTGRLDTHPNREQIYAFLEKHHVQPVFLTKQPIFDIGGAISV